jgi:hypothetical protein
MRKALPSFAEVRRLFDYCYKVGGLLWKRRPATDFKTPAVCAQWNSKHAGKRAGTALQTRRGGRARYVSTKVGGRQFYEHHLVAVWHGNPCPAHLEIDHIDNNPRNNRITNLRFVTGSMNCRKQGKSGVRLFRGRWMARITIEGKRTFLGNFSTEKEAINAREKAEPNPVQQSRDPLVRI